MNTEILNEEVNEQVNVLINSIKNTNEYKEYEFHKDKVKKMPELKARIDEFRRKNYELQNSPQSDNLMEEIERMQKENEELYVNPISADFLQAELEFCRLMQNVNARITEAMNFE